MFEDFVIWFIISRFHCTNPKNINDILQVRTVIITHKLIKYNTWYKHIPKINYNKKFIYLNFRVGKSLDQLIIIFCSTLKKLNTMKKNQKGISQNVCCLFTCIRRSINLDLK